MRLPPLSVLLGWPKSNFINPVVNPLATVLYVLTGILLGLATLALVLRLWARIRLRNWFGLDDLFICLALIPDVGLTACLLLGYNVYHWDRHIYDVPGANLTPSLKILFAAKIFFAVAAGLTRMSLVFFYYRILDHIQINKYRWVLHVTMFFIVGLMTTWVFVVIFNCTPVYAYWSTTEPANTTCINGGLAYFVLSIINTVEELIVALLPFPVVMRLRMDWKQRFGVLSLLSLGLLVAIIGTVRCYYVWVSVMSYDLTWYSTPYWICSIVEINVALICACVPALRHLFRGKVLVPFMTNKTGKSSGTVTPEKLVGKSQLRTITERYHPYANNGDGVYQTIDFDGAMVDEKDAFGHTVNIMSDAPRPAGRKMYGRLSGDWRFSLEEPRDTEVTSSVETPPSDDIGCRKSLEIRVSYHEGSNDVKSLHVQRGQKTLDSSLSYPSYAAPSSTNASEDDLVETKSGQGSSWLIDETNSDHSTDSEDTNVSSDESEGEKSFGSYDVGVAVQQKLKVAHGKVEEKSVSLSDFDFDPRLNSRSSSATPTSAEGRTSQEPQRRSELLRPTNAFVRRSLSTIASENTRTEQRSSVNRSSNGDLITRTANFGPGGLPEIRRNRSAAGSPTPVEVGVPGQALVVQIRRPEAAQQMPASPVASYQAHRRQQSSRSSHVRTPSTPTSRARTPHVSQPSSPQTRTNSRFVSPSQSPQLRHNSSQASTPQPGRRSRGSQASTIQAGRRSRGSQGTLPSQPASRRQSRHQPAEEPVQYRAADSGRVSAGSRHSARSQQRLSSSGAVVSQEWWVRHNPPAPPTPSQDDTDAGALWSYAFNRIFSPQRGLATGGAGLEDPTSSSDETKHGDDDDDDDDDDVDLEAGFGGDETSVEDSPSEDDIDESRARVIETASVQDPSRSPIHSWFDNRNSNGS